MELAQFIETTLLDITRGIKAANAIFQGEEPAFLLKPGSDKNNGAGIHFDVAVTTLHDVNSGGKPQVKVADVEISGADGEKVKNERISRIAFTVSVDKWVG